MRKASLKSWLFVFKRAVYLETGSVLDFSNWLRYIDFRMKIFLNITAVLLILAGGVWFLQGINLLPGSFMTGQIQWAIYGGIAILAGVGLIIWNSRRKTS